MNVSRTIISLVVSVLAAIFAALGWDITVPSADAIAGDGLSVLWIVHYIAIIGAGVFRVLATKQTNSVGVKTGADLG